MAISKEPNPTVFQKTLGVNDYYFASDAWEFPMGNIQMVGKSVAEMYRGEKPLMTKLAPTFSLAEVADHAIDFWLSTEDLPLAENRVSAGRQRQRDAELQGDQRRRPGPAVRAAALAARSSGHAGAPSDPALGLPGEQDPGRGRGPPGRHLPLRLGPGNLGAEHRLRAHELDNLYVVDTSFFPSISAVNPALTAMANAVRVGDHLLERLGGNAG